MMDNTVLAVFQRMRFGCFYRVRDLVEESGMPESTVRYALTQLNRGGLVMTEKQQARQKVYASRQPELFA